MGNETDELKKFLTDLGKMEKELSKMSSTLNIDLSKKFEQVINSTVYDGEKRGKVNKKPATMYLAKDGSIKIQFDKLEDGREFFKSFTK